MHTINELHQIAGDLLENAQFVFNGNGPSELDYLSHGRIDSGRSPREADNPGLINERIEKCQMKTVIVYMVST